jgi:hypothetical protein
MYILSKVLNLVAHALEFLAFDEYGRSTDPMILLLRMYVGTVLEY